MRSFDIHEVYQARYEVFCPSMSSSEDSLPGFLQQQLKKALTCMSKSKGLDGGINLQKVLQYLI